MQKKILNASFCDTVESSGCPMCDGTAGYKTKVRVRALFPMEREGAIFAVVEDTGWDYRAFGPIEVGTDSIRIPMHYRGYTGHAQPVLIVAPADSAHPPLQQIVSVLGGQEPSSTYIERVLHEDMKADKT